MTNHSTPPTSGQSTDQRGVAYAIGWVIGFTARWTLRLILLLLLLLLISYFLIQVPAVQRWAAQKSSEAISKKLGVEVSVGQLELVPFTNLRLNEVMIGDEYNDTLLVTDHLDVTLVRPLRSLWNRSLYVESVLIEGASLNLYKDSIATSGNYDLLLRHFAQGETDNNTDNTDEPFNLNLTALQLRQTSFKLRDDYAGNYATGSLDSLELLLYLLNLPEQRVDGNILELAGLNIDVRRDTPLYLHSKARSTSLLDTLEKSSTQFQSQDQSLFGPMSVSFADLDLSRASIKYVDNRSFSKKRTGEFDPNNFKLSNLELSLSDLAVSPDSLGLTLEKFAVETDSGVRIYDVNAGLVSLTDHEAIVEDFTVQTGSSRIGDRVKILLPPDASWKEVISKGRFSVDIKPSVIQIGELKRLVPKLAELPFFADRFNQKIQVRGRIRGTASSVNARDLEIRLPDGSMLAADIGLRNVFQQDETVLNLQVEQLTTSMEKLRKIIPGVKIPTDFDKLGNMTFDGRFDGFLNDFVANGNLTTDLGEAKLNTRFIAKKGVLPEYTGIAELINFDLGSYSSNPQLGLVTAKADIRRGIGLRPADLELDLIGSIASLEFRGYTYRDIEVNGTLSPEAYEGAVRFKDEHADLDFNGKIDLQEADNKRFDFQAAIRKLDLKPLKLSDQPWSFQGAVAVKSNTLDLDNLEGEVAITDFALTNPDGRAYAVEQLSARQRIAPDGSKRLNFDSPLALIDLSGEYQLLKLPSQLHAAFAKTYPDLYNQLDIPITPALDSIATRISLDAKLLDTDSLFRTFSLPIRDLNGSQLAITLDTDASSLDVSLSSKNPRFGGITLTNVGFDLRGQSGELDLDARAQRLQFGGYGFEAIQIFSEYADGDIRFSVSSDTATTVLGDLNFAGAVHLDDTTATFSLDPSSHIDIGGERWTVAAGNELIVGKKQLIARDVQLEAGERYISLESSGARGLNVLLRQFNLELFNTYLNPDKIQIQGEVDAYFSAEDIYAAESIMLSASIDTFKMNGVDWGALQTLVSLDDLASPLSIYTTFSRLGQQAVLEGQVALKDDVRIGGQARPAQYFDASLTSEDFDMSFLSYFIPGITDLQGKLGAAVRVYGTPQAPIPQGGILVDDCALTIDYLKTRYFVDSQFVSIDERILDASGRQITDRFGNIATITGGLVHQDLKKWDLDVSIRTDRLEVLRTSKTDNPLYYGDAYADGKVAFSGPFNQTDIDIDAKALNGTKIVFPVSGTSTVDDLRFITFRQPEDTTKQEVARFLRGINLDMDIEVTPVAELMIVFDEAAGDILRGQGTGTIQIDVNRSGSYSMDGVYTISEGDYLFTLLNVVNKPFDIRPGGTINWNGDPFNAQLELTAAYDGLNVAPYGLISQYEEALKARSNELLQLAYQPTQVDLLMKLTGELQRPDLAFEIELPNLQGDLRNYVNSQLALIRQDENLLNRQVFGLIVIGQFLPEVNELQASSVGFNTISELFSNQFSYLLTELFTTLAGTDGALSGIDLDLNLQNSSLQGVSGATGNSLQTQLKTYFFEDRLEIGLGANFGRTVAGNESGRLTAGKFEVSYALTEDRRLRLKTFASTDVDIQESSRNRAGVGLTWRRQFDSFSELIGKAEEIKARNENVPIFTTPSKVSN